MNVVLPFCNCILELIKMVTKKLFYAVIIDSLAT